MIGKVVAFFAVAVSCAAALPFGNCGQWDLPGLGNLLPGPTNILPGPSNLLPPGLGFPPPPPPIVDGVAAAAAAAFPPNFPVNFPGGLFGPGVSGAGPLPLPAPTVQAPLFPIQRLPAPPAVPFPNLPGQFVQGPPIVQNIETGRLPIVETARLPTIHTRLPAPAFPQRIQTFETGLTQFPPVNGQIFPGSVLGSNPFSQCV